MERKGMKKDILKGNTRVFVFSVEFAIIERLIRLNTGV